MEDNVPSRDILVYICECLLRANDAESLVNFAAVCKKWKEAANIACKNQLIQGSYSSYLTLTRSDKSRGLIRKYYSGKDGKTMLDDTLSKIVNKKRHWLGNYIGSGGFSRVFQLGNLDHLCIKIGVGGNSVIGSCTCCKSRYIYMDNDQCKQRRQTDILSHAIALYTWSSTDAATLICREHVNLVIEKEFSYLATEVNPRTNLLPRVFQCSQVNNYAYYIMERLPGITLRQLILNSSPFRSSDSIGYIDLSEPFEQLVETLIDLGERFDFWHGDIKPENIILFNPQDSIGSKNTIRLIDPVPRDGNDYLDFKNIFTLPYNPKAFFKQYSDICSLATVGIEIATGERIFQEYKHDDDGGRELWGREFETTQAHRKKQYQHDQFLSSLFAEILGVQAPFTQYYSKYGDHKDSGYLKPLKNIKSCFAGVKGKHQPSSLTRWFSADEAAFVSNFVSISSV